MQAERINKNTVFICFINTGQRGSTAQAYGCTTKNMQENIMCIFFCNSSLIITYYYWKNCESYNGEKSTFFVLFVLVKLRRVYSTNEHQRCQKSKAQQDYQTQPVFVFEYRY